MKLKICRCCGKAKPRDQFYRMHSPKFKPEWDCRDSYCMECRSSYATNRRRDIKQQAVEYLGGKCAKCGIDSKCYALYDFHHKDPTKKDFSIGKNALSFKAIKPELDKCELLCANCHRLEHYPRS